MPASTAPFASKSVIMDEPAVAQGVQETAQVENVIRDLKGSGIPMILINHNQRQVFDLVDRIVVFGRGGSWPACAGMRPTGTTSCSTSSV